MTEQQFDPRDYGRLRAEAERARQEASAAAYAEMSRAASREAFRSTSARLRAAHRGLLGASGQELAAEVSERPVRIGQDFGGGGRVVEPMGGLIPWRDVSDSPAPVSHDMRWIDRPHQRPVGKSPGQRWLEENR